MTCRHPGCSGSVLARGLCPTHYKAEWRKAGGFPRPAPETRLWAKIDQDGPPPEPGSLADRRSLGRCWVWTGATAGGGYGYVRWEGRAQRVHRVVYELLTGPIPAGLVLDHLCRRPSCVRPDHLEPVTHQENMGRSGPAVKTRCRKGHELTPGNTYIARKTGARSCLKCRRERRRKAKADQS